MRLRALAVLALSAVLLLSACPAEDPAPPPPPPPTPPTVGIELIPDPNSTTNQQVDVKLMRTPVPSSAHELIWTSTDPADEITIEFLSQSPPPNPPKGTGGKLHHQPNWSPGQYKGDHRYRATVDRNGRVFVTESPELIIEF